MPAAALRARAVHARSLHPSCLWFSTTVYLPPMPIARPPCCPQDRVKEIEEEEKEEAAATLSSTPPGLLRLGAVSPPGGSAMSPPPSSPLARSHSKPPSWAIDDIMMVGGRMGA